MLSNNTIKNGEIRKDVNLADFSKLYSVFSGAPFFENWTPEMVTEVYNSFKVEDGYIFGYYIDNECVGILAFRPYVPGEHPVRIPDNSRAMYLSDIATLPGFRGNGIGTKLLLHGLDHIKVLGYDYAYLRTNEKEISMSYNLAVKCGFTQIPDLCQEIIFERTSPYVSREDLRIFLEKKI